MYFSVSGTYLNLNDRIPSIMVESDESYEIGLISLYTYMSIKNIETDKNDKFYFGPEKSMVTIKEGTYEINKIEDALNKLIVEQTSNANFKLELQPDIETSHIRLRCTEEVDFTLPNTIGDLLGFTEKTVLEKNKWHCAPSTANIFPVNIVRVVCNIAHGSYSNGEECHVIYDFFPTVDIGFKIVEKPKKVIYFPIKDRHLTNIEIKLVDQDGKLVNFGDEIITVSLHLRKRWD